MKPTFSILHATFGRPEKAVAAMRATLDRASRSDRVEYIFACNTDDPALPSLREYLGRKKLYPGVQFGAIFGNFTGSAPAWNAAANQSSGQVLIQMQDDLEMPDKWDTLLLEKMMAIEEHESVPQKTPIFIGVSDGFRTDALCCTAIMNRARYVQQGEFLHPGYMSVFSDDDVTYRALRDAKEEKCKFIEARDLVFLHRHAYHDKDVPLDATYERENSPEAYRIGALRFAERNPLAATDGIRTWG